MSKQIKLIMVTAENNNKYYNMEDTGDGNFKVVYGRVDVSAMNKIYPMSKWNSIFRSKIKKGYKEITDLFIEESSADGDDFKNINLGNIARLVERLQAYANKTVQSNYSVSSDKVTEKQIEAAQNLINDLTDFLKIKLNAKDSPEQINKYLIDLYMTIPRKMNNVKNYLFKRDRGTGVLDLTLNSFKKKIDKEQSLLDVMQGQVATKITTNVANKNDKTILDALGLKIVPTTDEEKTMIKKLMGPNANQFVDAYKVVNKKTESLFRNSLKNKMNKKTGLFWHGSRNENWWSIINSGLLIRPTNAIHTGSMFGDGIYFADKARKSIGYTSLSGSYWASGSSNEAYLALFRTHTGSQMKVQKHQSWMYQMNERMLKSKGNYDSLFAKGGIDLYNNEYIVYNKSQCTLEYIVKIRN